MITKKIPAKFQHPLFAFFMALMMSCIMSLVITLFNVGWVEGILHLWLKAWAFGFMVALPAVMIVAPIARKIVVALIDPNT